MYMKKLNLANLLISERDRVNNLPNGDSYQISIVVSKLASQLDTTEYYVDKWIREFTVDGLVTFVHTNRTKNIFRNGKWDNAYRFYDINTDRLKEFISEGLGYNGELRVFANYLKSHMRRFDSTSKKEIKTLLGWNEKKYHRRIDQLIKDGIITNWRKEQRKDKSYIYFFEFQSKLIEPVGQNTVGKAVHEIQLPSLSPVDEKIDDILKLVRVTDGNISKLLVDEMTLNKFEYVIAELKNKPMYRFGELHALSDVVNHNNQFAFRTSYNIVAYWFYLYRQRPHAETSKTPSVYFSLKKILEKIFLKVTQSTVAMSH